MNVTRSPDNDGLFSSRTAWAMTPNPLTREVERRRQRNLPVFDWTASNPTECGFAFPATEILSALSAPASLHYTPEPRGLPAARGAVCSWYGKHGVTVHPDNLILTSGSSEAYSFLFRTLCDPGDSILVPKPGYPLIDDIARLNDVVPVPYHLRYDGSWHLDPDELRRVRSGRTRGLVVIHPNNPTGHFLTPPERSSILDLASSEHIPLIVDEVFLTYPFLTGELPHSFCSPDAPILFVLNGLSKLAALPQMKLGWIAASGTDAGLVREALSRLEMIGDTYLSVNTPVQVALPRILELAGEVGEQIRLRVAGNYRSLQQAFAGSEVSVLQSEAGWNCILRLPATRSDEAWAIDLVMRSGIRTHPGYLFELNLEACLVVSLLPDEVQICRYAKLLLECVRSA